MDLTKIRQVASVLTLLTRSLGFRWGAALARVRLRVPVLALRAFSDGVSRELSRS